MKLGYVIKQYRYAERTGIRALAKELGISPATLSRIERGEAMDGWTLAKLIKWLLAPTV